ncbi:MAG: ATP-binding cassette domain-containing protein [Alphaproteobacteria bacterium]|nr:ATP-binding cassette domain-containing protein [Alphaproteobacteria bacterium]
MGTGAAEGSGALESADAESVVRVRGLRTAFGAQVVHDGLDLDVRRGEILGIVGGSGTGKSVLLRMILGLDRPVAGSVEVLGRRVVPGTGSAEDRDLRRRWGVLFQDGALFSSLTVAENVALPLKVHADLPPALVKELVDLKLALAGLAPSAGAKLPSQLSGGMRKRAGLARALVLDPEILFLDEPTAGLDPIGAAAFDRLVLDLSRSLRLTLVMVTHDLDTLVAVCDRIAVLIDKRIRIGTLADHLIDPHPWMQAYFRGPRGRAAQIDGGRALPAAAIDPTQAAR